VDQAVVFVLMEVLAAESVMFQTVRHVKMIKQDVHNVSKTMVWVMMDHVLSVEMDLIISAHHVLSEPVTHALRTVKPVLMTSHALFAILVIKFKLFGIQHLQATSKTVLNVQIMNIPHLQRPVQLALRIVKLVLTVIIVQLAILAMESLVMVLVSSHLPINTSLITKSMIAHSIVRHVIVALFVPVVIQDMVSLELQASVFHVPKGLISQVKAVSIALLAVIIVLALGVIAKLVRLDFNSKVALVMLALLEPILSPLIPPPLANHVHQDVHHVQIQHIV